MTLLSQYQTIRATTLQLCDPLEPEDFIPQPMLDASPPKWNLAHTTWFFETFILKPFKPGYLEFDPHFNFLFNSYYQAVGPRAQRPDRGLYSRPTLQQVLDYRHYVDDHIHTLLESTPTETLRDLVRLGLNHEQQHQELLLTDLKYLLFQHPIYPVYANDPIPLSDPVSSLDYLPIESGLVQIGYEGDGFHFDNEKGRHTVFLHESEIANRLITNAEFLEFIKEGAYQNPLLWLSDGWDWKEKHRISHPLYWLDETGDKGLFTLHGVQPLDLHAPVTHVSYYEADAFAAWAGKRLATEFEWETACRQYQPDIQATANLMESGHYHPVAENGPQFYGQVWEWTQSAYLPYPGFKRTEGAIGEYNGKFMINQMVLRGGSTVTPRSHIRLTYRNFFHPDKQWQFTGIRLADYR